MEYGFNIFQLDVINYHIIPYNLIKTRLFYKVLNYSKLPFPYYNVSFLQKTVEMEIKLVISDQTKPFSPFDENGYFVS